MSSDHRQQIGWGAIFTALHIMKYIYILYNSLKYCLVYISDTSNKEYLSEEINVDIRERDITDSYYLHFAHTHILMDVPKFQECFNIE